MITTKPGFMYKKHDLSFYFYLIHKNIVSIENSCEDYLCRVILMDIPNAVVWIEENIEKVLSEKWL